MAPLEPWEKVLVDSKEYPVSVHGYVECTECHLGQESDDKETAHTGIIARPSENSEASCGSCHPVISETYETSLHSTQEGYWTTINARSDHGNAEELEEMFGNHCSSCHTTCGDCHVSQPASVGGGFIDGHNFNAKPSMTRNCTACHGSRVGNEYLGKNEGVLADLHFRQVRMTCVDCHTSTEIHNLGADSIDCTKCHGDSMQGKSFPSNHIDVGGSSAGPDHRYDGAQTPKCENCHGEVVAGEDEVEMHEEHGGQLSCQVCHSVSYSSCDSCHVELSEETGKPKFSTGGTYLTFLIGKNVNQSYARPYEYVPVRHIPIDTESYSFYGGDLLPNFDALPTWAYATPHNIQRNTPQTETCDSCHGNSDIFLTEDKVDPSEIDANLDVIIFEIPAQIDDLDNN